ncbi:phage tail protein [Escherichia coli]|uniref:phage tail protein n=9 Tax=Escherichia coli TaxID=562 RepID=UPI000D5796F0|nr:phage tail protein [Escherichia coli]EFB5220601.1 phage tail protein [Escherichia coli]EFV2536701.1 phage tail protein [Escherichia coli]EID7694783.1 tail fiber protein [Escherichia coli]MBU0288380.1 tail fiber protein [Escherichia coli]MCS0944118.1 tail fiber protein [Escherichia coli]
MNDVTVVTSVTYPSSESLALVADVQYHEPYLSAALNRKFRGIVDPGFYAGFLPKPGGGMNLLITSVDGDKTAGAASVDIGEFYQVTIQQRKDISLALSAGKKYAIVLKGRYLLGEDTYQVNTASHIHAAEFVARTYTDSYQLGDGELLVCTVNIPASVSAITQEMIDTSERINRSIGIDISDSVTSTRSDVAASSLAVKKAYDLAKSKYTAQDASTTQKGLVQLSSATNSDSETMAATPKAVKSIKDLADTKAPIESPSLTGTPTAPTAAQGTNSTQIANTAFVKAAITALINGAPGTLDTLKEIAAAINNDPNFSTTINNALALKAPLASPALTGIPTAPTAAQGTNNTQIANTAFVKAAITALINGAPGTLDTLKEIAAAINNDPNFSTTINNALALKAPLASPALTGVPTAPTAAQGTNNTQIATTAYVRAAISALVGSSPEALDTLNELAAALGNDPNFATTMTNALAGKQPLDATLTALAALATGANKLPYFTGKDTVAQTDLTSVGRDILAKTSTLAVIQYLGLRELGTSGEKIPLLSTANTWSARQTFNGGITGALTGNADTATKLKTAININGVRFDGSADITLTPKDLDVYSKSEIDNKKGMRKYTFSAPANAVSGKWYPIVFRRSGGSTDELASRVVITTYSSAGGYAMNNCEFNGFVMPGGWSDRGSYAAGFFSIYSTAERAIHSIISSVKDDDLCSVFYVEARAFPIKIFAEEGLNVIVPTTDYTVGQATYKWGATDPVAESTNTQTILDFKNGRGYYCSHQFVSSLSGNAATATKLASSINIGGVSFDGSADIDLPGVNTKGNQDTTGNAATATKLQTACTINGVSFDGSKDIELNPRSIGTINSTTMSFSGGAGWFKLATVTMPQASSVVYISLIGGAGYNVGSPHQAGISELVLRAGNGNPKGITGALWRRTSIGFTNFAWENTSGDTYDVYVEIGNYATGVNIQWDYTSNASVTIHTSPIYTENKPTGLTDGTVYVIYSSHIKPTAADVGALSLSGGQLNGALGIGTSSALGGNSIVLGDNDTGFKQNGDGNLDVYANNVHVMRFVSGSIQSNKTINITGRVNPSDYGNFDSRYVRDMRLGGASTYKPANNTSTWTHQAPSGCVYTGIIVQDTGSNSADNIGGVYYRPVQKQINGTWYNVAQV